MASWQLWRRAIARADVRPVAARPSHHWRDFAAGALTSLFAHELAHVVTAVIVGGQPTLGFDRWRPTVYSGIDVEREPRKQFLFSSMGLNVQAALDEAILDVPHARGAACSRAASAPRCSTSPSAAPLP